MKHLLGVKYSKYIYNYTDQYIDGKKFDIFDFNIFLNNESTWDLFYIKYDNYLFCENFVIMIIEYMLKNDYFFIKFNKWITKKKILLPITYNIFKHFLCKNDYNGIDYVIQLNNLYCQYDYFEEAIAVSRFNCALIIWKHNNNVSDMSHLKDLFHTYINSNKTNSIYIVYSDITTSLLCDMIDYFQRIDITHNHRKHIIVDYWNSILSIAINSKLNKIAMHLDKTDIIQENLPIIQHNMSRNEANIMLKSKYSFLKNIDKLPHDTQKYFYDKYYPICKFNTKLKRKPYTKRKHNHDEIMQIICSINNKHILFEQIFLNLGIYECYKYAVMNNIIPELNKYIYINMSNLQLPINYSYWRSEDIEYKNYILNQYCDYHDIDNDKMDLIISLNNGTYIYSFTNNDTHENIFPTSNINLFNYVLSLIFVSPDKVQLTMNIKIWILGIDLIFNKFSIQFSDIPTKEKYINHCINKTFDDKYQQNVQIMHHLLNLIDISNVSNRFKSTFLTEKIIKQQKIQYIELFIDAGYRFQSQLILHKCMIFYKVKYYDFWNYSINMLTRINMNHTELFDLFYKYIIHDYFILIYYLVTSQTKHDDNVKLHQPKFKMRQKLLLIINCIKVINYL